MASLSKHVIRFGPFEVDPEAGDLRKNGHRVRLQEQPLRILLMLLQQPGETVTRDQIQQQLWPDGTFVDFEHGVNTAVRKLRSALGDNPDSPRFVETIPRRGYRFIAPVETPELPAAQSPANVRKHPLAGISHDRQRRWVVASVIAALLLLAALMTYRFSRARPSDSSVQLIRSIAVLPLADLSGDPSQEYFADGMTDALITDLSKIDSLRIISRTSVMQYKGTHKTVPEIARELKVDGVIEGSVMRSGNRVRIAAQLIHAPTDRHLWAENYERDLGDILRLQSEVAQAISEHIRVRLPVQQQARLASAPRVDPAAYDAYLKGLFFQTTDFSTREGTETAKRYYEEATQKDSSFALAYVGLASCYENLGGYRWVSPQDAYRPAKQALNMALQLDENLGEAHSLLGWLAWRYGWDWPTAEKEFKYGLELNPNHADSRGMLALYLSWSGRPAEAFVEIRRMHENNPSWTFDLESALNYHQRDYTALLEVQPFMKFNTESWLSHYFLGVGFEGSRRWAEAVPEYQKAVELSHGDTDPTAGLAHAYAASGQKDSAEKILRGLLQESKTAYVSPYMIGTIYAGLGNKDKAFEFLEKAYQERSPDIPYFLKADLRLDSLRSDPRFQDLVRRVKLPQ